MSCARKLYAAASETGTNLTGAFCSCIVDFIAANSREYGLRDDPDYPDLFSGDFAVTEYTEGA